jgi:hypothetical protein
LVVGWVSTLLKNHGDLKAVGMFFHDPNWMESQSKFHGSKAPTRSYDRFPKVKYGEFPRLKYAKMVTWMKYGWMMLKPPTSYVFFSLFLRKSHDWKPHLTSRPRMSFLFLSFVLPKPFWKQWWLIHLFRSHVAMDQKPVPLVTDAYLGKNGVGQSIPICILWHICSQDERITD